MTTKQHDQHSEPEYQRDLEAVRLAWSGREKVEPPELLDQAVLNTARRELSARRKPLPLRWLGAFATATVVVLAMTIVIQQDEQAPALEKSDGFMLDQAIPAAPRKEAERDGLEEKPRLDQTIGQSKPDNDERARFMMKQNAAPPAVAASDVSGMAAAQEPASTQAETENGTGKIPEAEAWIERLLLLRETQQDEKLVAELAAFRETYPGYPLPPELH
jgi:hypothetical protein